MSKRVFPVTFTVVRDDYCETEPSMRNIFFPYLKMSNLFILKTSNILRNIQINSTSSLACACSLCTYFFKDQPKHSIHFRHA